MNSANMIMAAPQPSEEERRLLREYRLTSVPSRRSSCSPATSNASSSTTNTANLIEHQQYQHQPHIITATPTISTPNSLKFNQSPGPSIGSNSGSGSFSECRSQSSSPSTQALGSDHTATTISNIVQIINNNHHRLHLFDNDDSEDQLDEDDELHDPHSQNHHNSHQNHPLNDRYHTRHNHLFQHSNHNHYHQKRHKNGASNHELSAEEITRMLDLVSELSYLRLVPPSSINNTNNGNDNVVMNNSRRQQSISPDGCRAFIFEKIDYIKKFNLRKKAHRKLKRARSKSRNISPSAGSESQKLI